MVSRISSSAFNVLLINVISTDDAEAFPLTTEPFVKLGSLETPVSGVELGVSISLVHDSIMSRADK